ncbi:MAG: endonuclease [Gemmatimonadaceae bacterium]|nr:endonuclease [Gemmatimonadaceae bacterium]
MPRTATRSPARSVVLIASLALFGACASDDGTTTPPPPNTCVTAPPAAQSSYYSGAANRCDAALLSALQQTVRTQRTLGYTSARDSLYAYVDRGTRPWIIDLYTGREAIGVTTRATAAQSRINTEHTWPRSRGAELDPALSDLHHLFSSDSAANERRSNYPYGLVRGTVLWTGTPIAGTTEVSRLGYATGTSGTIVFEPRASVRGDIARALLYFHLRYNADRPSGFSLLNFAFERDMLLAWAREDPVDAWERLRNDAVFRAQGNRNPFIDWPELLDLLPTPAL